MKRKLTLSVLFILVLASVLCTALAVNADEVVYGDHVFDAERMMQFDEGTRFENGFVNGGIINPGLGTYSTYQGIKFESTVYEGEKAVKVELLDGAETGYFDFNYYQWDADAKKPALDASKYPYFKVRIYYDFESMPINFMKFWASKETDLGKTVDAAEQEFVIFANENGWTDAIIRLDGLVFGDGTSWHNNTVRQFRLYMYEHYTDPNAVFYVAGMGFFETEEEALGYDFATEKIRPVVTYDANGGVYAPNAQVKENGKALKLAETEPGKAGYRFMGWSTKPDGDVKYKPGDYYRGNKGDVLYAVWKFDSTVPEGEHIFDVDRMMTSDVTDEKILNYWAHIGTKFTETTYKNEPAVKVELLDGETYGYFDFYYFMIAQLNYEPSLYGSKYRYFKIRYAYENANQTKSMAVLGFKATEQAGGEGYGIGSFDIDNGYGEWREEIVDLGEVLYNDGTKWTDNLVFGLRYFLFEGNTDPNAACYIAGMGFFETEEQAKSYDFNSKNYGSYIEYDANGGVGAPLPQIKKKNIPLTITDAVPGRLGYKFMGWSETPDGNVLYRPSAICVADKSITLYAVWEKDTQNEVEMGDHIFAGDRLGEYIEGTRFHNGFVDGGEINPVTGDYSTYVGISHHMTVYKGEKALEIELLDGYTTGYLDFSYYQWNAESYEPSLDSTKYRYLRIRYAMVNWSGSGRKKTMTFWASKDAPVLGTLIDPGQKSWSITLSSGWSETIIDLKTLKFGDDTFWGDSTVRQFRIYPFEGNTRTGALVYISGIGFFETKEEAQSYDFATGTFTSTAADIEEASEVDVKIELESATEYTDEVGVGAVTEKATEKQSEEWTLGCDEALAEEANKESDVSEIETEALVEISTEIATEPTDESTGETDTQTETEASDEDDNNSIIEELVGGNQIAIGIITVCIIGVFIVAVVVLIVAKKKY